jgi:alpha-glucan phosphorylase-like protein
MQSRPNLHLHRASQRLHLPERLGFLDTLTQNCWWSWQHEAQWLFAYIWPEAWDKFEKQPIRMLQQLPAERAQQLSGDPSFLAALDQLETQYNQAISAPDRNDSPLVAYFCMEYGIMPLLKLYSGGLGILAGDFLKEASDQCRPLVALGLWYGYGYFKQQIDHNGQQQALYEAQDKNVLPLSKLLQADGQSLMIQLNLPGRTLYAQVWLVQVGRVQLYLLDCDLPQNREEDRQITHHLYGGDSENRLKQEILLGLGGVQLLEKLGIQPAVYHYNEGHAAFAGLARLIQLAALGKEEAFTLARAATLFTTHTPVPAGHDSFPENMLQPYLAPYVQQAGWSWPDFMALGRVTANDPHENFNMSHLACRLAAGINGVSALHGEVSRQLLHQLWPKLTKSELPIGHITNGVHATSWTAPAIQLYRQNQPTDPAQATSHLWEIRSSLKRNMLQYLQLCWEKQKLTHKSTAYPSTNHFGLREDALTIGFARRFATYKRAGLLFTHPEKLKALMRFPIQFVFAGKAHPADAAGQALIRDIIRWSRDPAFSGRILFLEDYSIEMAQKLVQGVDVWLNTPTRPLEASGTSGMKASMNGVLNLSVLDGWWAEGYRPDSGWALPLENTFTEEDKQNELDANRLYTLLEEELLPCWLERDENNLPNAWLKRVQQTLSHIGPAFSLGKMFDQYASTYYQPLARRFDLLNDQQQAACRALVNWQKHLLAHWEGLQSAAVYCKPKPFTGQLEIQCWLESSKIEAAELQLHCIYQPVDEDENRQAQAMQLQSSSNGLLHYTTNLHFPAAGNYTLALRIMPHHVLLGQWDQSPCRWVEMGEYRIS